MNRQELRERLLEEGFEPTMFSVDGEWIDGAIILTSDGRAWYLKYMEKGAVSDVGEFSTEESACQAMYERMHRAWPGVADGEDE